MPVTNCPRCKTSADTLLAAGTSEIKCDCCGHVYEYSEPYDYMREELTIPPISPSEIDKNLGMLLAVTIFILVAIFLIVWGFSQGGIEGFLSLILLAVVGMGWLIISRLDRILKKL